MARLKETEQDFLGWVIDVGHTFGWQIAHFRPAKTEKGWRTAVSADGVGFPDIVMLKGTRQMVVELKSKAGKVSPEQTIWLDKFVEAGVETYLLLPSDRNEFLEMLVLGHPADRIELLECQCSWQNRGG